MTEIKDICRIVNGVLNWELKVDGTSLSFNGTYAADYFAKHYADAGYEVRCYESNGYAPREYVDGKEVIQPELRLVRTLRREDGLCVETFCPKSSTGDLHKTPVGVKITHIPTMETAECTTEGSVTLNKKECLRILNQKICDLDVKTIRKTNSNPELRINKIMEQGGDNNLDLHIKVYSYGRGYISIGEEEDIVKEFRDNTEGIPSFNVALCSVLDKELKRRNI